MRLLPLAAAGLLLLGACGSTSHHGSVAPAVASRLASESDAVAAQVQAGNGCQAADLARQLQRDVHALAPQLEASANAIAAEVVCVPAPPQPTLPPGQEKKLKHEKHGHKGEGG